MAAIKFMIKIKKSAKKNIKGKFLSIYIRMYHSKLFDFEKPINIFIEPQYWDDKNQRVKRSIYVENNEGINDTLDRLRSHMFSEFNIAMISEVDFDRKWFEKSVASFFGRPEKQTNDFHKVFFTDWCSFWLDTYADKHKVSSDKYMSEKLKSEYANFVKIFKGYQGKSKIKFTELLEEQLDDFSKYMTNTMLYSYETTKRNLRRLTFFMEQAVIHGMKVPNDYKKKIFVNKEKKKNYIEPYFNEHEIDLLFNLDLSKHDSLDDVRDNLIISVWTGLRISDFNRLDIDNIKKDFIQIESTQKTGVPVVIPIHPQVKRILNKRKGDLPRKTSEQKYNENIKEVAKMAGISNITYGGKTIVITEGGKKIRRKVSDFYPKHELVTSHIGRRSFATNLFGKVPNRVIMDIGGWKSEDMMLKYIKKTKQDSAVVVKKIWETEKRNII